MPLTSLIYISTSTIDQAVAEAETRAIVSKSVANNRQKQLTGALLFTGRHFAQVLEGRDPAIASLLTVLATDPRHKDILVVDRAPIAARRFPEWSMAYLGPSLFVERHISRLMNAPSPAEQNRAATWLTELLIEFSQH
jgi:hypothetical protein